MTTNYALDQQNNVQGAHNIHLPLAVWETVSPNLVQKLQELQAIIMKDLE
jgi:hypothetical protein